MKANRHSYIHRLWREIVFAEFEPSRKLMQLVPYWLSSPRRYEQMTKNQQRLERVGFWFELFIFGSVSFMTIFSLILMPGQLIDSFVNGSVAAKIGMLILIPVAFYRALTRQGYLRWMYAHHHR